MKSPSENLYEALSDQENQNSKNRDESISENLSEALMDKELNLPLTLAHMQDGSKLLVEETIKANIGTYENPKIIELGATLSPEE